MHGNRCHAQMSACISGMFPVLFWQTHLHPPADFQLHAISFSLLQDLFKQHMAVLGDVCAGLTGGEGAPELTESLLNVTINGAALAAFSWLFLRDYRAAEKDKRMVDREEALGRLLVHLLACCFTQPHTLPCIHFNVTWNA